MQMASMKGVDGGTDSGEVLWRKLVERKVMKPENERKKPPVFKVGLLDQSMLETMFSMSIVIGFPQFDPSRINQEEGQDGAPLGVLTEIDEKNVNKEEAKAAKFIQGKFREMMRRKSSAKELNEKPSGANGTNGNNSSPLSPADSGNYLIFLIKYCPMLALGTLFAILLFLFKRYCFRDFDGFHYQVKDLHFHQGHGRDSQPWTASETDPADNFSC